MSRRRPEASLRHRHARGASVEDLAVRFEMTRAQVRTALAEKPLQLRTWSAPADASPLVELVAYSEQGQRLEALVRDLEKRAQRITARLDALQKSVTGSVDAPPVTSIDNHG